MALDEDFNAAKTRVQQLTHVSQDQQLELYGLYKQAQEGDVKGTRPGMLDFKGRAKYDAWSRHKGKTSDEAKQAYVAMVGRVEQGSQ